MRRTRLRMPWDQTRALDNARSASKELSTQRVAREEVEIYLEQRFGDRGQGRPRRRMTEHPRSLP
jgi:hypothetical protein